MTWRLLNAIRCFLAFRHKHTMRSPSWKVLSFQRANLFFGRWLEPCGIWAQSGCFLLTSGLITSWSRPADNSQSVPLVDFSHSIRVHTFFPSSGLQNSAAGHPSHHWRHRYVGLMAARAQRSTEGRIGFSLQVTPGAKGDFPHVVHPPRLFANGIEDLSHYLFPSSAHQVHPENTAADLKSERRAQYTQPGNSSGKPASVALLRSLQIKCPATSRIYIIYWSF